MPASDSRFSDWPARYSSAKAPSRLTGTARPTTATARQSRRNRNSTSRAMGKPVSPSLAKRPSCSSTSSAASSPISSSSPSGATSSRSAATFSRMALPRLMRLALCSL